MANSNRLLTRKAASLERLDSRFWALFRLV